MKQNRMKPGPDGKIHFMVTSGFGGNTREPFVQIEVNGHTTQMSPESARALGLNLLQAAEAAEVDAHLIAFLKMLDMDEPMIVTMLKSYRSFRDKRHGESPETA